MECLIHILAEITFLKEDIRSHPLSTFMEQNIGSNKEKQKLPQILTVTNLMKGLSPIQI